MNVEHKLINKYSYRTWIMNNRGNHSTDSMKWNKQNGKCLKHNTKYFQF